MWEKEKGWHYSEVAQSKGVGSKGSMIENNGRTSQGRLGKGQWDREYSYSSDVLSAAVLFFLLSQSTSVR